MVGERVAAARPQHSCSNVIAASLKTVMQQNTRRIPSYGLERTITRAEFCAGRSNRGSKQAFACECYATLIRLHPEVKPLFTHTSMEKQAKKFMASLTLVLHVLGKPDVLTTTLQRLGRRHQTMGVRVEHYPMVAEALLATLKSGYAVVLLTLFVQSYMFLVRKGASHALPMVPGSVRSHTFPHGGVVYDN